MFKKKQQAADQTAVQTAAALPAGQPPMKKKKGKKIAGWIIAAVVILAILALMTIPKLFQKPVYPSVSVTSAFKGDVQETLDTSGIVKSEEVKTYFSPVNATIQELNVKEGDPINQGDKLVVFDLTDLEKQNKEAELQKAASQYGYQDTMQKSQEGSSDYQEAVTNLDSLNQQIADKKAELTRIQDALNADSIEYQRALRDYQEQMKSTPAPTPDPSADPNASAAPIPKAEPNSAEEMPTYTPDAELTARLETCNSELAELQSKKAEYEATKSSGEASKLTGNAQAQLKANNELAKLSAMSVEELLAKGREGITADFSGIVTKVAAVQGGPTTQGGELFTIASNKDVVLEINVSKYDLEKISVGQKAIITLLGNEYSGEVTRINRVATTNEKGTTVVAAEIKFDNPDENIYLGVEGKVSVQGEKSEQAVLVPVEVVNTGTEGSFVYIVENNQVAKRMVTTGVASDEFIEIKEGLKEGEQVITSVTIDLQEGKMVNPIDENAAVGGAGMTDAQTTAE